MSENDKSDEKVVVITGVTRDEEGICLNTLQYGDGSIRTYPPDEVDPRCYMGSEYPTLHTDLSGMISHFTGRSGTGGPVCLIPLDLARNLFVDSDFS